MADKSLTIAIKTKGAKKAKNSLGSIDNSVKNLAKSSAKAAAGFFAVKGLITGLTKSVKLAGEFAGVESGFKSLAKQSGFSSVALTKLQKATDGTIDSLQLMKQANNAMLLGIADSEDQMAEMFDVAQRLGSALGQDTAFAVDSLVTGLGRQSKLMLDNLGIMVDTGKANEEYAAKLGLTVDQLTDQQKKQAFVNAAMASANTLVDKLGAESLTTTDHLAQMNTAVTEMAIAFGEALGPAVTAAAKEITAFLNKSKRLYQDYAMGQLGEDTLNILINMASNAQKFVTSGHLELIEHQIKALNKAIEDFPAAARLLLPTLDNLNLAASKLRESTKPLTNKGEDGVAAAMKFTADESRRFAEFTVQAATSLATSAMMGDNVAEAFKRMLIQQILITSQMKIQAALQAKIAAMEFATTGPMALVGKGLKFLFGASPTQAAPSPNVTINQNFGGMGTIDTNFAANSIIPAINKAITTGQARITR